MGSEQNRTDQNRPEQNIAEQNRTDQNRTDHHPCDPTNLSVHEHADLGRSDDCAVHPLSTIYTQHHPNARPYSVREVLLIPHTRTNNVSFPPISFHHCRRVCGDTSSKVVPLTPVPSVGYRTWWNFARFWSSSISPQGFSPRFVFFFAFGL